MFLLYFQVVKRTVLEKSTLRSAEGAKPSIPGGAYSAEENADGTWNIRSVPIFAEHEVTVKGETMQVGQDWQVKAHQRQAARMQNDSYMAPLHVHHHALGTDTQPAGFFQIVDVAQSQYDAVEVTYNAFVRLNFEKTYESMLTTSIQPEDLLAGEVLWAMTRSLIYGVSFFIVIAAFGLAPMPGSLLAIAIVPLTGLLFATIGIVFSLQIPSINLFSFYFTLFLTPLFLFSDIFFPIAERLSGFWLGVAEALPLLHPVRLTRAAFGAELSWILVWDFAYIVIASGVFLFVAARVTRRRLSI